MAGSSRTRQLKYTSPWDVLMKKHHHNLSEWELRKLVTEMQTTEEFC